MCDWIFNGAIFGLDMFFGRKREKKICCDSKDNGMRDFARGVDKAGTVGWDTAG